MPDQVLALTPSAGVGGGIEAYVRSVIAALETDQVEVRQLPLLARGTVPTTWIKAQYAVKVALVALRGRRDNVEILCFHLGLLPVALLAQALLRRSDQVTAFFYGAEIWGARRWERRVAQSRRVRPVAISSFSAGAMSGAGPVLLIEPAVDEARYKELLSIRRAHGSGTNIHVLSVFRFDEYATKGGSELIAAVAALRSEGYEVSLTIAGRHAEADELDRDLKCHGSWIRIVASPSERQLIDLYSEADVFALATRLQRGPDPAGEGFGIVLAEAALAGLPVVAPTNDGSHDALIGGLTGLFPADDSVESLATTIRWLADNPDERATLGRNGRLWAERMFEPARYGERVRSVLWGKDATPRWLGLEVIPS